MSSKPKNFHGKDRRGDSKQIRAALAETAQIPRFLRSKGISDDYAQEYAPGAYRRGKLRPTR